MNYRNVNPVEIEKKWGRELCLVTFMKIRDCKHTPDVAGYSGKILEVNHGWQSSIHYHIKKTETFYVLSGQLVLELYRPKSGFADLSEEIRVPPSFAEIVLSISTVLKVGNGMTLDPLTMHRFWSLTPEGCKFIEFSTPDDPKDSYRIVESGRRSDDN
jgi:D-lyxose ketol-isomerase